MSPDEAREGRVAPVVAIFPWGDVFRDFLDRLGVTREALALEFSGSWMFGWAAALRSADVATVIVCPTSSVSRPERLVHRPTGAGIVLLPTGPVFSTLREHALVGRRASLREPASVARAVAAHLGPYLGTPPRAVARTLRAEGCLAVVCQEYETPRFDVLVGVGRRLRVPVFGSFQGGDYQLSRLERPLRPLSLRGAAGILVGADEEERRVTSRYRLPASKIHRIGNPVDTAVWAPSDRAAARSALGIGVDAHVVAWHGQLQVRRKGLDVLLDAWRILLEGGRLTEPTLVLVGAGEDAAELAALSADLAGVRLIDGWVDDRASLRDLLGAADLYVFPSRHEGVPVAPLEALACGLPVVGADAAGVSDVVGDCGTVVPREDPAALARALEELLLDSERRHRLGLAARRRAEEHFSLEAVGRRLRATLLGPRR